MKTCLAPACRSNIFSHKFCKRHQYLRTDDKFKRKGINKRSPGRSDEEREYRQVCDEIDEEAIKTDRRECVFCGWRITSEQWDDRVHHHQFGRAGKLLTDKRFIKLAHWECHQDYHQKSVSLLWWWRDYMERIKNDTRLFNKETKREEKEGYAIEKQRS